MKKLYLEGTKTMILEDSKELKLDYYLVEDRKDYSIWDKDSTTT